MTTETINAGQLWAGDIMACYGADRVSRLISLGTFWPTAPRGLKWGPSHVAIIIPNTDPGGDGGEESWIESTTKAAGNKSGVQRHRPHDRVMEYIEAGGHVECYRPTPIDQFSAEERRLLWNLVKFHFLDRDLEYDLAGAIISGTRAFKHLSFLTSDLGKLFCSELIAALLQRIGRMNRDNPTKYNPASLLRQLVRQGTYHHAGHVVPSLKIHPGSMPIAAEDWPQKKNSVGRLTVNLEADSKQLTEALENARRKMENAKTEPKSGQLTKGLVKLPSLVALQKKMKRTILANQRERCAKCNQPIPPGKPGRSCKTCRGEE